MSTIHRVHAAALLSLALLGAGLGCTPEVGSEAWCEDMRATPKGEWSANDARDYAKHCLFE